MRALAPAAAVLVLALVAVGDVGAEIVARGANDGMLALGSKGTPFVAHVRGSNVVVATRVGKGRWREAKAGVVSPRSRVMAFQVGAKGPVALVQSADDRTLVLVRPRGSGWQQVRLVGLSGRNVLGWPGLVLDGSGLPVVAYTRLDPFTENSQLVLSRVDAQGRVRSQLITAEGFPQSDSPPPAAPVFVHGRVHVVQSFGYRGIVGTIEWYPDGDTWTGLFIGAGHGEFPVGPVFAGTAAGNVYAAWTQTLLSFGFMPVTLVTRGSETSSEIVLDRGVTAALALPTSGPELAANEWVAADEFVPENQRVWTATVVSGSSHVQLDGSITGFAVVPGGGRDLLLVRPSGLSWFRSPHALARNVSLEARSQADGTVRVSGQVSGVTRGRVTLYRERPGRARSLVGEAALAGGSFSHVDRPQGRPVFYRAVYTDPATGIPYSALLSRPVY